MYEANTWLWNFGQPQPPEPSVSSLSAAKTEKICKRSQCTGAAERTPGRPGPGKPPRVLLSLRLMQTYDMYIPVIYLSYPLDQ